MGHFTSLGIKTKDPSLNTAELRAAKKLSATGTTLPRYFSTNSGCSCTASDIEQKITPSLARFSLKVVATETLSNTASTATLLRRFCSERGMPSYYL